MQSNKGKVKGVEVDEWICCNLLKWQFVVVVVMVLQLLVFLFDCLYVLPVSPSH